MLSLQEGNLSAEGDKEEEYNEQVMRKKWGEMCFITLMGFPLSRCVKRQALLSSLCVGIFIVAFVV